MSLITKIVNLAFSPRMRAIELSMQQPHQVQHKQLKRLTSNLPSTHYGRDHGITSDSATLGKLPIVEYDDISRYTKMALDGRRDVLWPGRTEWFAKSSGTTSDKSKYIPVTREALFKGQFRGGKDALAIYLGLNPQSKIFGGKSLTLGGSRSVERGSSGGAFTGDLSAIMIANTPAAASLIREPKRSIALIADFNEKVEAICRELSSKDMRTFAGVPSWNMVLLSRIVEYNGANNLLDVWPNMELFVHGGISFVPYRDSYKKLIPSDQMHYIETYNASEGFFAVSDRLDSSDMLLMLDYGNYYEFLEMSDIGDHSKAIPLEGVKMGTNYALIISNTSGLWRYMIGDTVEFTSLEPYRIRITGRTSHCINTFGEEVMVSGSDRAITEACRLCSAKIEDYTVAPIFMDVGGKGAHQWAVEFREEPKDLELFAKELDRALRSINSDYDAKRTGGATLSEPVITHVSSGTFYRWMASRGKVGGQNKIPRLSPERKYIEQLLKFNL